MNRPVTIVIPWSDRLELRDALRWNTPVFRAHCFQLMVVNCGGNPDELDQIMKSVPLDSSVIHLTEVPYNTSLALNIGIAFSQADYVFVLGADVILSPDTIDSCMAVLDESHVVTIKRLHESAGRSLGGLSNDHLKEVMAIHTLEFCWSDGSRTTVPTFRRDLSGRSRGGQGQLIAARTNLLKVGGYNSQFVGWGFEDIDILVRLQRVLNLVHVQVGEATHISHGDDKRVLKSAARNASNTRNVSAAIANYSKGVLLGSLSADVSQFKDRIRSRVINLISEVE